MMLNNDAPQNSPNKPPAFAKKSIIDRYSARFDGMKTSSLNDTIKLLNVELKT